MLSKLITAIISPLGTSLILGVAALLLAASAQAERRRRHATLVGALALGWLGLWSLPIVSESLRGWIEDHAGPRTVAAIPQAAVIVVLGGGVAGPRPPRRPDPDLTSSADRLWHAARLFHAGKAPRLLLSGGTVGAGNGSEAEAMREVLIALGVPAQAMILETGSTNTESNARLTAQLLARDGIQRIILVTSALHMPRARAEFERVGIQVIPAAADFEVVDVPFDVLRFVPTADALEGSARAMKELLGWWLAR